VTLALKPGRTPHGRGERPAQLLVVVIYGYGMRSGAPFRLLRGGGLGGLGALVLGRVREEEVDRAVEIEFVGR
jgi:hypothetical protein